MQTTQRNLFFFFFNDTATTEIYTLSLHDALPISLETIKKVIPFTGTLSPGSPVVVYIRLPYRASLTYRRWVSQDKGDTLGIVPPPHPEPRLPYGGDPHFSARNNPTREGESRAADLRHRLW